MNALALAALVLLSAPSFKRESVRREAKAAAPQLRACGNGKQMPERLLVDFMIDEKGAPKNIRVSGSEDGELTACIARVWAKRRFDAPSGGAIEITYPLTFEPPEVDAGTPPPPAPDIDKEAIRRVIDKHRSELRRCYEEATATHIVEGRVVVRFTIAHDGSVSEAQVVNDETGSPTLGSCVEKLTRTFKFQKYEGTLITISYPFVFKSLNVPDGGVK